MKYRIKTKLSYALQQPCELLFQIHAAALPEQIISKEKLAIEGNPELTMVAGEEGIGNRVWLKGDKEFNCSYKATVEVTRKREDISQLQSVSLPALPQDVTKYLLSSNYCQPNDFNEFLSQNFSGFTGGSLVLALCEWIKSEFTYDPFASNSLTNASKTMDTRRGICRDYAHVLITMLRASSIPARIVSAYSAGVNPPDFHAVVEVYLDGGWVLIDPTGMATPEDLICIGVGRDATDVSFLTSFGLVDFQSQSVLVEKLD